MKRKLCAIVCELNWIGGTNMSRRIRGTRRTHASKP
jgi:hypothetical protein